MIGTPIFYIKIDFHEFVVHLDDNSIRKTGKVYPCQIIEGIGHEYMSKKNSTTTENIEDARCFFEFSYVWRGVWEGRFYPRDTEYWGMEVELLYKAWVDLENQMQDRIKQEFPDFNYD